MREFKGLAATLLAFALVAMAPSLRAQAVDCRSCHKPGGAPGAADLTEMYVRPEIHHPIGVAYPGDRRDLAVPDGLDVDITFFDRNHDGIADADEVQMFDVPPQQAVIECATCHMEHGYGPPVPGHPPKYLRFRNTGSSLCTTCHIM
jgi:mono/diheme cytochrome c family protein